MLNFSAISWSNHSLLVFFILAVFKGAILLTTSIIFWKKIVVCLVYIIFRIVWECNFAQSLFVLIYWILLKRSKWNYLCPPTLSFLLFLVQKIIWWSDNPILIIPHCVIFPFVFVNMWPIRVDVLGVTLVGDFINCLRPKVLQNSRYFFVFDDTFIVFLFYSPNIEPFWYKFILRSPSMYHSSLNILSEFELFDSISRNLVWAGRL